jgi:hypothetical protein
MTEIEAAFKIEMQILWAARDAIVPPAAGEQNILAPARCANGEVLVRAAGWPDLVVLFACLLLIAVP